MVKTLIFQGYAGNIRTFGESAGRTVNKGAHCCIYQNHFKFLLSNENVPWLKQAWKKITSRGGSEAQENKGWRGGSAEEVDACTPRECSGLVEKQGNTRGLR